MSYKAAIFITPMITGFLSLFGSSSAAYSILSDFENKGNKPYFRIFLGICIFDIIGSVSFIFSAIPSPKESGLYGAHGTTFTCSLQGVGIQISLAAQYLTALLMIYFLTTIRYTWSNKKFVKKCEIVGYTISIVWPSIFAIIGLTLTAFNPTQTGCFVNTYPQGCDAKGSGSKCIRGVSRFSIFNLLNVGIPVVLCVVIMIVSCILISHHVWKTHRTMSKWRMESHMQTHSKKNGLYHDKGMRKESKKEHKSNGKLGQSTISLVMKQAFLYTFTYAISIIPGYLCTLIKNRSIDSHSALVFLSTYPLQGFWNFFIFFRPRVLKLHQVCPNVPLYKKLYYAAYCRQGYNDVIRISRIEVINNDAKERMNSFKLMQKSEEGQKPYINTKQGHYMIHDSVSNITS